jgi:hypothetical protein
MQDKKDKVRDMSAWDMLVITPLATMALLWLFTYMWTPRALTADEARIIVGAGASTCDEEGHTHYGAKCSTYVALGCWVWCDPCPFMTYQGQEVCEDTVCWRCFNEVQIHECNESGSKTCVEFGSKLKRCGDKLQVNCVWTGPKSGGTCSCPKGAEMEAGDCPRDDCV